MPILGKLSPTNGGTISVVDRDLCGCRIEASLLSSTGKPVYTGMLHITMGSFINSPKDRIRGWATACGRTDADFRGPRSERNTVYYYTNTDGRYNLHFEDLLSSIPPTDCEALTEVVEQNPGDSRTAERSTPYDCPADTHRLADLRKHRWSDVPQGPGVYWWFFPRECVEKFKIADYCDLKELRLRQAPSGKLCLYVGVATSLQQRIKWHAEQKLTLSALRSGFLSTLRKTLLVLNTIEYEVGFGVINEFMDRLEVAWHETGSVEAAEQIENGELDEWHYPLNIRGNSRCELQMFLRFLSEQRKAYKELHDIA
jgi:hypothetical protein